MKDEGKYVRTWRKYIRVIGLKLKASLIQSQELKLDRIDFITPGNRLVSGYTFNIQMNDGKVLNNLRGSQVARTLVEILSEDRQCREFLNKHQAQISLDKDFVLLISSEKI